MVAGIVILALVLAAGGIGYAKRNSGGGSTAKKDLVILSDVQRRTLQDTVTLQGTLARQELRKVTSVSAGRVSAVYADDGSRAKAGDRLFALDGRDAIAENGTVRFFRPLSVGDRGDDVLQLKRILAASGDNPGPLNTIFTEQTRFALAQWQAQHHYPGAVPDSPQTVTVSLGQGTGYTLGAQVAAGLTIGPGGAQTTAATTGVVHRAELTAFRTADPVTPTLKIQSLNATVSEGTPATFSITASDPVPTGTTLTVNLYAGAGNSATSDDVVIPPSVTMAQDTSSVAVSVPTRVDDVVKPTKKLVLAIGAGNGYFVGSPSSAQTMITNHNVPEVHISGATTLSAGGSAKLTVSADQAPLQNTQVSLTLAGDAVPGTDYQTVNPVLLLPAGKKTASLTIHTLKSPEIQPNHHIVASITQAPSSYSVGAPGIAVITIVGASGVAALPIVTLRSATTFLVRGGSGAAGVGGGAAYPVTISLSKAVTAPLTVVLAYGGNAAQGADFTLPGGSIVIPPGQTSLTVQIPIVSSNVVESNRVLIVALAPTSSYQIGRPNTTR